MRKEVALPTHILVCDACGRSSIDPLPDVAMRWTFGGRSRDWATSPGAAHDLCPECVSQALAGVLAGILAGILARRDAPPTECRECGHTISAHGPDGCGYCTSCAYRPGGSVCTECGHSIAAHGPDGCYKGRCSCSKRAKDFEVPG